MNQEQPDLLADIGGTNARFALVHGSAGPLLERRSLLCADFRRMPDAVKAYLDTVGAARPRHAVIAVATPVVGDDIRMVNHDWRFQVAATRAELGLESLRVINDFTAVALGLPSLGAQDCRQVGGGSAVAGASLAVLGPGTGLGVPGLVLLYEILHELDGRRVDKVAPADVTRMALQGDCPVARQALLMFCGILGSVAGNLALTLGARGGVYIGGGIVPKLGRFFDDSPFRERFEQHGRFTGYLAGIPTYVIQSGHPALLGARAALLPEQSCLGVASHA